MCKMSHIKPLTMISVGMLTDPERVKQKKKKEEEVDAGQNYALSHICAVAQEAPSVHHLYIIFDSFSRPGVIPKEITHQ